MKAFKFYCEELYYAYSALTQQEAIDQFKEDIGGSYTVCEEIPETKWDEKIINIWEDNDFEKEPFKVSIRESIVGAEPQLIFSNDPCFWGS